MHSKIQDGKITFTDGRFYQHQNNKYYPSATTILEAYPKSFAYLKWLKENGHDSDNIMEKAGERGSIVHELTEKYDLGYNIELLDQLGNQKFSMNAWAMLEKYHEFSSRFKPQHYHIEKSHVSETLGFGGTIDRVCRINGKKYILDIKTSGAIYNSYWLQLAAYRQLYLDMIQQDMFTVQDIEAVAPDGVAILWLNAKTVTEGKGDAIQGKGWQLVIKEDTTEDWQLFKSVQELWLAEHKNEIPKQLSYQLSYQKQFSVEPKQVSVQIDFI